MWEESVIAEFATDALFDFALPGAASDWQTVNDGVMGGVSEGKFKITGQMTLDCP